MHHIIWSYNIAHIILYIPYIWPCDNIRVSAKSYKIHRSIQTPRKIIMPGIVDSLCAATLGPYFYGSIQNTLYCWDIRTGRCFSTNQAHYQSIKFIKTSKDFTITGSDDGQIAIYRSFALVQVHDTLQPIIVINAHSLPVTDLEIKDDFCFTSSTDFSIKVKFQKKF